MRKSLWRITAFAIQLAVSAVLVVYVGVQHASADAYCDSVDYSCIQTCPNYGQSAGQCQYACQQNTANCDATSGKPNHHCIVVCGLEYNSCISNPPYWDETLAQCADDYANCTPGCTGMSPE
jgi:hypothetical protein